MLQEPSDKRPPLDIAYPSAYLFCLQGRPEWQICTMLPCSNRAQPQQTVLEETMPEGHGSSSPYRGAKMRRPGSFILLSSSAAARAIVFLSYF